MSLGVVYFFITRFYVPLTPRSYDLHLGSECFKSKLETNLIVALAGAAVANSVCALIFLLYRQDPLRYRDERAMYREDTLHTRHLL
mgnify:CR=1 FL=1